MLFCYVSPSRIYDALGMVVQLLDFMIQQFLWDLPKTLRRGCFHLYIGLEYVTKK
jgi:hypothetical protein